MPPTHEVLNQVPPLTGYDVADDPVMLDALRRAGASWAEAEVREIGLLAGTARAQDWGRLANENPPVLHTHDRFGYRVERGRVPPGLARTDERGRRRGPARRTVAGPPPGRARGPRREVLPVGPDRRRPLLPGLHDLRDRPGPAERSRSGPAVRAGADVRGLRPGAAPTRGQARPDRRHVDDREAGRLRRPRQHHPGGPGAGGAGKLPAHRAQVVHVGADERRVPGPRPGARRPVLLPAAPGPAGRHPQWHAPAAAQGQARQPVQRVRGGGVRRGRGLAGGGGGPRRRRDHRDGQHDPAGTASSARPRACGPGPCRPPTTPRTAARSGPGWPTSR